jgi:hypothetical protein
VTISDTGGDSGPGLAAFQAEVVRLFFGLPKSKGFLLAGGAALLAQHLTTRPTEDLDFFTPPEDGHVPAARDALEEATRKRGWSTERIHDSETFCRLVIRSDHGTVLVDLAVNAPPDSPPSITEVGPTLAPEELAGHKLLALMLATLDRLSSTEIPLPDGTTPADFRAFYSIWQSELSA